MIIRRKLAKYLVTSEESILSALNKITENESRIVFVVSDRGVLEGVLSDGDVRRWLVTQRKVDLNKPVSEICNKNFIFGQIDEPGEITERRFSDNTTYIPLVDHSNRIVAVAVRGHNQLEIGEKILNANSPTLIIAEIGNNHNGSLQLAKRLIDNAVMVGADCAKFQMRNMERLYQNGGNADDVSADLGAQYTLDLLSRFQLSNEQLFEAFDYCRAQGILPLCTPWDNESLDALEEYGMAAYKVASADFTNHPFIEALIETGKPLICSTGMCSEVEIKQTVDLLMRHSARFVLLHCNSTYPAPLKDINLNYMARLQEIGQCLVGYSSHERDINVAIAAVSQGAKIIEKHFTLDKSMEGNDHKVSLLPNELKRMIEGIRQVEQALGSTAERQLTQGEMMNREILAKSIVARRPIKKGLLLTKEMLDIKSPGNGLQPNRLAELTGRRALRDMSTGDVFYLSDLEGRTYSPRQYDFKRPWGFPVRFHDCGEMISAVTPKLLEFHLSYKDMEVDIRDFIDTPLDMDFVVHSPELFSGDHVLNLCAQDNKYRQRSIEELQQVVDLTRSMKRYFKKSEQPLIVTNVGGFSPNAHLSDAQCSHLYGVIKDSLSQIDAEGVEIIPQTMPPFPWHFGGQRFHNLFVDANSIVEFCSAAEMRICFDISHSKLACNHYKWSFHEFVKMIGPYVAHMHIADASGVDGEGLQIGEGDTDFVGFLELIDQSAPDASFIPEVWQGHKNRGEGFWIAFEQLDDYWTRANGKTDIGNK